LAVEKSTNIVKMYSYYSNVRSLSWACVATNNHYELQVGHSSLKTRKSKGILKWSGKLCSCMMCIIASSAMDSLPNKQQKSCGSEKSLIGLSN